MLANATRELMFHDTIEEDNLRSNPAAQYRAASYQKQSHESRGNLLTNALADHRPQPVRQDLSIARLTLSGDERTNSERGPSSQSNPNRTSTLAAQRPKVARE